MGIFLVTFYVHITTPTGLVGGCVCVGTLVNGLSFVEKKITCDIRYALLSFRFSRECYLDFDSQVTCRCPMGYEGRRCEQCSRGYMGNPQVPGESCRPGK